ncbi:hypothetical protein ACOMHN_029311 [Nucella lapillus]
METTTPNVDAFKIDSVDNRHNNQSAFLGCYITFTILACLLNGFVILFIVLLYVKQPPVRLGVPKLGVVLASCVLQFIEAATVSSVAGHISRVTIVELKSTFTCEDMLSLELISFMLSATVSLLVGAVVLLEGVRLQRFVSLSPRVHVLLAVTLAVLSVLYGFVIVIPVFFFNFLNDKAKPCFENDPFVHIAIRERSRALNVVEFLVPHCLIATACLLLLMAFFTRSCGSSRPGVYAPFSASPLSPAVSGPAMTADRTAHSTNAAALSGPSKGTDNAAFVPDSDTASSPQRDPSNHANGNPAEGTPQQTESTSCEDDSRLPWYVLLAAVVSFVFGFVSFFNAFADVSLPWEKRHKLWAAGRLLYVLRGVFLPCCWLLDSHVRGVWSLCRPGQRSGQRSGGSAPQAGQEMVIIERL